MGQLGPHLHLSGFVTVELGFDWPGSWGSTFIAGGLGFVAVMVAVLVLGGISQFFLISKTLPDIFPALGQGVPMQTGHSFGVVAWLYCLDQA